MTRVHSHHWQTYVTFKRHRPAVVHCENNKLGSQRLASGSRWICKLSAPNTGGKGRGEWKERQRSTPSRNRSVKHLQCAYMWRERGREQREMVTAMSVITTTYMHSLPAFIIGRENQTHATPEELVAAQVSTINSELNSRGRPGLSTVCVVVCVFRVICVLVHGCICEAQA